MRRWLAACVLATCAVAGQAVEPGETAPAFELPVLGGEGRVSLRDLRGHWVYLDFWASWCAPCRDAFPWMSALQEELGDEGLRVVAISVDRERANAKRFLDRYPADFVVAWDGSGTTPEAYDVPGMPSSYVIDPRGVVRAVHRGFYPDEADARRQRLVERVTQWEADDAD